MFYQKLIGGRRLSNARFRMTFATCKTSHYIYTTLMVWAREELNCANSGVLSVRARVCVCVLVPRHTCMRYVCDSMRLFVLRQFAELDMDVWEWWRNAIGCYWSPVRIFGMIHSIISFDYSPLNSYLLHFTQFESDFFPSINWMHILTWQIE